MDDDVYSLVIDNGSDSLKAGFSGDDEPKVEFPSVVGQSTMGKADTFVGDEAQMRRDVLSLRYPINRGVITNWDDMERIWHYTFYNKLRVAPYKHPVFLTDPLCNRKANQEMMAQIMFETFHTPAMYIHSSSLLALYAAGRTKGVVVDCGGMTSRIIPICGENYLRDAFLQVGLGGSDLTNYLMKMITNDGHLIERDVVNSIKEKLCYVAQEFEQEMLLSAIDSSLKKRYKLPDGQVITIGNERLKCPEALFNPRLLGMECAGIHEMVYKSIMKHDKGIHSTLYGNIVLCGSTTLFPGFAERMYKEMVALAPPTMQVKIVAPPERKNSVWVGGSIMSSLSMFQEQWITKKEYEETGPSIVHGKGLYILSV